MIKTLARALLVAGLMGWATGTLAAPTGVNTSWKAQVSRAILEGRCNDAKTIALKANDIDTASQAVMLCKPKPKPSAKVAKRALGTVAIDKVQEPKAKSQVLVNSEQDANSEPWISYHRDSYSDYFFNHNSIKKDGNWTTVQI